MGTRVGGGRRSAWWMTVTAAAVAMVAASCDSPDDHPPPDHPPDHKPPGRSKKPDGHTPEPPPPPQPICQGDGWCWENPLPHGDTLLGVWTAPRGSVAGANDTFAVGALGIIQRRHAGGWVLDDSGVSVTLNSVWGSAGNDVWAVGDSGTIVHFDGARWSPVTSGTTSDLKAVWVASAADAWIVGPGDTLLHFNGDAWVAVAPPVAGSDVFGVYGIAANEVWAGGERFLPSGGRSGIVMHWDGHAWTDAFVTEERPVNRGTIRYSTVWASSPSNVWAGGFDILAGAADIFGTLIHFDGTTWAEPPVDDLLLAGRPVTAIFGASPTDLWGAPGMHWDGTTWSRVLSERTAGVVAIQGRATDDLVAVGRDGRVLHFNGDTWEDWNTTLTDDQIVDAWGAPNGEIFAVTETMILHYDGRGWSRAFHGPGAPFVAVWGTGTDNVVFLREDGELLTMTDGFLFGGPVGGLVAGERLTDVWTAGDGQVLATGFNPTFPGGAGGRVIRFRPSVFQDTWQGVLSTPLALLAISGSAANDIWVAGQESVAHHFDGTRWAAIPIPDSFGGHDALWVNSPTDVWLAGFAAGSVYHWDGTALAATPPTGSPSGANALWSNGPNNVWAAGSQGVAHWDGEAWTDSTTNVGNFPFWQAIWQTPDGKVRVFGDGGAILRK